MEVKVSITGHLKKKESFALVGQTLGTPEGKGPSSSPSGESYKQLLQTLSPHCVSNTGLHLLLGTAELGPVIPPGGSVLSLTARQSHCEDLEAKVRTVSY